MSTSPPSFSKICYVKVCVLKNWKQLFLSKLILYLLGQEYGIYFSFLTYIFSRYLQNIHERKIGPTKYLQKKNFRPTRKNLGPTKYLRQKITDPRRHGGTRPTMPRDPRNLPHSFLYYLTQIRHLHTMHGDKKVDVEKATTPIILLVSLVPVGAIIKICRICGTPCPWKKDLQGC